LTVIASQLYRIGRMTSPRVKHNSDEVGRSALVESTLEWKTSKTSAPAPTKETALRALSLAVRAGPAGAPGGWTRDGRLRRNSPTCPRASTHWPPRNTPPLFRGAKRVGCIIALQLS
jgi:hypothetical protein